MFSPAGLLCAALLLARSAPPHAMPSEAATDQEESPGGPEPVPERDLSGSSPANLIPKLEIRHQFVALDGGAHAHTSTIRMDILLLRRALLRYELPLVTLGQAGVQRRGLGDIQLESLTMVTSTPRHVTVLLAGVRLDSASQPVLGAGKHVVDFGIAGAFKLLNWCLLYGIIDQQLSFAGDDTRPDVNRLVTRWGSIVFGPERDWFLLDLAPRVDFHDDGRARLFGAIEAGRLLRGRVGLFVRAGAQLLGRREVDYTVGGGVRYLFQLSRSRQ